MVKTAKCHQNSTLRVVRGRSQLPHGQYPRAPTLWAPSSLTCSWTLQLASGTCLRNMPQEQASGPGPSLRTRTKPQYQASGPSLRIQYPVSSIQYPVTCALSTPRISFGHPKTVICAVSGGTTLVPVGRGVHVEGCTGVRAGWVYRGGYTGWGTT